MRFIDQNKAVNAEAKLKKAVMEAEKGWKKGKGKDEDNERMAICLSGLGYYYVCIGKFEWAATIYKQSLQIWEGVHGKSNVLLLELKCDVALVASYNKDHDYALTTAKSCEKLAETPEQQALVHATVGFVKFQKKEDATEDFKKALGLIKGKENRDCVNVLGLYCNYLGLAGKTDEAAAVSKEISTLMAKFDATA